jgi:glycine cleavage system H lipoate-binding protein
MSKAHEVKENRRYTRDHEWADVQGEELVVGITGFAVDQLGDITLVNWDVEEGENVEAGQVFGTIESVKTLSDLFAPVAGRVARLNLCIPLFPAAYPTYNWPSCDPWYNNMHSTFLFSTNYADYICWKG